MTDIPDPRATSELSVVDAWRQIVKPAPSRAAASYTGILVTIGLLNLSAIAAIVAALVPDPTAAMFACLLHTALIPGMLLALAVVPSSEVDAVEWLTLALGFGILVLVVGGLALALLPVRLSPATVVGWTAVVTLAVSTVTFKRSIRWQPPTLGARSGLAGALLIGLVAALLRLPGLGYSEFQGDETEVILRAAGVVQNLPDAVFYHGKVPGEVVVVALHYGFLGKLSEGAARLPFALAGIGGVLAFYVAARRLIGTPGAVAGALLLAMNGYFLAFSRITQYQSLVLLLGMVALWCALRWSQGGSPLWPVLAGAFTATSALAHYDALFFLPPIALAALWRTGWRGLLDNDVVQPWLRGAQVGAAILALFFVPYLESPLFGLVTDRIGDRVGTGFPYNNVPSIVASAALYLGTVFPLLVAALIALGAVALVARGPDTPSWRVWLLGLTWAAVPFLFYAFVARKPGTHIHVATIGLLLLAGAGFGSAWAALGPRRAAPTSAENPLTRRPGVRGIPGVVLQAGRAVLVTGLAVGLVLVGAYLLPVYLVTTDEVARDDHVDDLPLTWEPPGGLPANERFGFPYRAGWKTIGTLFADETLVGSYDSNEQPQVTHWYTRGTWRCSVNPRYYVIAENVLEESDTPERTINSSYHKVGTVTVAGEEKLRVYERGPARGVRPETWRAEDWATRFDGQVSAPTLDPGPWARGVFAHGGVLFAARFGEDIDLLGYQVFAEDPRPGGVIRVDLFWLPHVTSDGQHRIDVQLGHEPRIGDASGPACDKTGAEREWTADQPFTQRVSIPIAAGAQPGSYSLLVGVHRLGPDGGPLPPIASAAQDAVMLDVGKVEVRDGGGPAR